MSSTKKSDPQRKSIVLRLRMPQSKEERTQRVSKAVRLQRDSIRTSLAAQDKFRNEVEALLANLEDKEKELEDKEQEVETLESKLTGKEKEEWILQTQLKALDQAREINSAQEKDIKRLSEKANRFEDAFHQERLHTEVLMKEKEEFKIEIAQLKREATEGAKLRANSLAQENEGLRGVNSELRYELAQETGTKFGLVNQNAGLNNNITRLERELVEERAKSRDRKNAQKKLSKLEKKWADMLKVMTGGEECDTMKLQAKNENS